MTEKRLPTEEEMIQKMDDLTRVLVKLGSHRMVGTEEQPLRVTAQAEAAWLAYKSLERLHALRFTPQPYDQGYSAGYEDAKEEFE